MCGIECSFLDIDSLLVYLKFKNTVFENYYVFIADQAVYLHGKRIQLPCFIELKTFAELMELPYVFERLILQFYPRREACKPLHSFSDFDNSSCEIVILVFDAVNLEAYAKDSKIIQTLYFNALQIGCYNLAYKTKDSDSREGIYV